MVARAERSVRPTPKERFKKTTSLLHKVKLQEFQHSLKEQALPLALFLHPDPTITYFTQMNFSYALLAVTPSTATIYLTKLDSFPKLQNIISKPLLQKWEKEFTPSLRKNTRKVGINKETLSVTQQEKIQKIFPSATFIDIGKKLAELRQTKTPEELKKMKRACHITSLAFAALLKELPKKTLHTEVDVALFLESFMRKQGAEIAFPSIVASGKNSATPHHPTSLQPLQKGFLQLDFGAKWQNYCADMSRVLYLGEPSSQELKHYQLLLSVQEGCIEQIKEGEKFSNLQVFASQKFGAYAKYFTHSLGHGIGIEVHEAPVYKDKKTTIQNIPFTIEPGIYFPGRFGLRIEDTLFWDGKKVEILTKAPKELVVVEW